MTATAVVHRNAEKQEAHLIFTSPTPVQAPLSMEFSRQEYWSGLPCPPPGNLPNSGTDPGLLHRKWTFPQLSHQGSLRTVERAAHPFSRGPSWPRNQTRPPALQGDSLPVEPPGKPENSAAGSLSLLQGILLTQESNQASCLAGGFFTSWATREAPGYSPLLFKYIYSS